MDVEYGSLSPCRGIAAGFISYTIIKLCTGKVKEISPVTAILAAVFLFTFLFTH